MAITYVYTNNVHYKTLENLPKLGFGVWKYTIWQPCHQHDSFFSLKKATEASLLIFREYDDLDLGEHPLHLVEATIVARILWVHNAQRSHLSRRKIIPESTRELFLKLYSFVDNVASILDQDTVTYFF
jgi:hypothetical protein